MKLKFWLILGLSFLMLMMPMLLVAAEKIRIPGGGIPG